MPPTSQERGQTGEAASFRFPKSYRLKRRELIGPLFDRNNENTRSITVGNIRLLYTLDHETVYRNPLQVGFAVSRAAGNAVQRNRLKRLMRESFRHQRAELSGAFEKAGKSGTMMILARRMPASESNFRSDLDRALRMLKSKVESKP